MPPSALYSPCDHRPNQSPLNVRNSLSSRLKTQKCISHTYCGLYTSWLVTEDCFVDTIAKTGLWDYFRYPRRSCCLVRRRLWIQGDLTDLSTALWSIMRLRARDARPRLSTVNECLRPVEYLFLNFGCINMVAQGSEGLSHSLLQFTSVFRHCSPQVELRYSLDQ